MEQPRFPNQMGNAVRLVTYPGVGVGGLSQRHMILRSDDTWQESALWSVTLDIRGSGADEICDAPGALAHVSWGVGGARHFAYVDWRRGQRFAIAAAQVQVELLLRNYTDWYIAPFVPRGWPATFRASMVPNCGASVPGAVPPTCSIPILNVGEARSGYNTVPPFARRVAVRAFTPEENPPIYNVEWYAGVPTASHLVALDVFDQTTLRTESRQGSRTMIPVPVEATQFRVRGLDESNPLVHFVATFELAL